MRPSKGLVENWKKKEPNIFFFTSDRAVALCGLLFTGRHALSCSSKTEKKKKEEKKAKAGAVGAKRGASTGCSSPERPVVRFWVTLWRFGLIGGRKGKQSRKKRQDQKKEEGSQPLRSMQWSVGRPMHPFLALQEQDTRESGNKRKEATKEKSSQRGVPHQSYKEDTDTFP